MQETPPYVTFRVFQINATHYVVIPVTFNLVAMNHFWMGASRYITYKAVLHLLYLSFRWGWLDHSGLL